MHDRHSHPIFPGRHGQAGEASSGFGLEYARDAFVRFTLEGATVISL